MLKRIKSLGADIGVYGVSSMLSQLLAFALLPLYTRALTPEDYGILAMLNVIPMMVLTLATSGMKSAVYHRFNKCPDDSERAVMLTTSVSAVVISASILFAACFVFTEPLAKLLIGRADVILVVRWSLVGALIGAIGEIPRVALQCYRRAKAVSAIALVQLLVSVGVTIILVVRLRYGVLGVVLGSVAGQVLSSGIALWAISCSLAGRIDKELWKSMSRYGLPYLPHRLQAVGMMFFGDYMVRTMLGLHDAGLFSIASRFAVPVTFATNALYQAWQPYKFKIFSEDPDPQAFFRSVFTYLVAILAYMWVGISVWGPELVRVMTARPFHDAALLVSAVTLSRVTQGLYPMLATGVDVSDNTNSVPLASFAGLVVLVVGAYLLVPAVGASGAAFSLTAAWLVSCVAFFLISQRQYPIRYDWRAIAAISAAAVVSVLCGRFAQSLANVERIGVATCLTVAFPALVAGVLLRSSSERSRVLMILEAVRSRLAPGVAKSS